MEKRIIPWIKKKLIEIIGEDEPTLVEFVSTRLKHKTKPEYILQEIKIALGKFFYFVLLVLRNPTHKQRSSRPFSEGKMLSSGNVNFPVEFCP